MGWVLGLGNGIVFRQGGSQNWSTYWTTHLYNEANVDFWVKAGTRSGMTLPDAIGANNAEIQSQYFLGSAGNGYLTVADNGALDIGAADFTFATWVKGETTANPPSGAFIFGGKYSGTNGSYCYWANTNKKYTAQVISSDATYDIVSEVLYSDLTPHLLLMEIDQTNHKFRFFIDNIQIGEDVDVAGTFGTLANAYEFNIGCANGAGGAGVGYISKASYSDTYIFNSVLTPTQKTTLFNRGIVTGAKAHWCLSSEPVDSSGNGYTLTATNGNWYWGNWGSRQGLNLGYSLYTKYRAINKTIEYRDDGTANPAGAGTGYTLSKSVAGDSTNFNYYNCYISFAGASWDRSDIALFNANARVASIGTSNCYVAAHVKWWHSVELNRETLNEYKANLPGTNNFYPTADHQGINFVKHNSNILATEFFSYSSNNSGTALRNILVYTGYVLNEFELKSWTRQASAVIVRGEEGVSWKDHILHFPLLLVDPTNANQLICFYGGGGDGTPWADMCMGRATAPIGTPFTFTDYASNPIMVKNTDVGIWDKGEFLPNTMIYNADTSEYYLYYNAGDVSVLGSGAIGLATSPDGFAFTRRATPVLDHSGDETYVGAALVFRDGATWYMYYSYTSATTSLYNIRLATSPDGITWTKQAGEILKSEDYRGLAVLEGGTAFKRGSKYYIFISAFYRTGGVSEGKIGGSLFVADSPSGPFTASYKNPIIMGGVGEWDATVVSTVGLFFIGSRMFFMYQGANGTGTDYNLYDYDIGMGELV